MRISRWVNGLNFNSLVTIVPSGDIFPFWAKMKTVITASYGVKQAKRDRTENLRGLIKAGYVLHIVCKPCRVSLALIKSINYGPGLPPTTLIRTYLSFNVRKRREQSILSRRLTVISVIWNVYYLYNNRTFSIFVQKSIVSTPEVKCHLEKFTLRGKQIRTFQN